MIEVTERDFDKEVLECELPVFACFTTKWCHTCYPTCLFADELVKEYEGSVKFVRVDTEGSPDTSARYRITVVPTILLFKNSQPMKKLLGFQERRSLRRLLGEAVTKEAGSKIKSWPKAAVNPKNQMKYAE
jgi:thioredoxin 1